MYSISFCQTGLDMELKEKFKLFQENVGSNWVEVSSKSAIFQCMDLSYLWVFVLNYPKATIQNAYAYQVYTAPKEITKKYFKLIKNTPEFVPAVGDLVVWDKKYNGTAGHIAIATGEGNINKFKSFDQNVGSLYPQVIEHDYKYVLGVLRPMVTNETANSVLLTELQLKNVELSDKVKKLTKDYGELEKKYAEVSNNCKADKELLQGTVSDLQIKLNESADINEKLMEETKLWNAFKNAVISLFKK